MNLPIESRTRHLALWLPPVIALIAAAGYTEWQARTARANAMALCSAIVPGDSIDKFVKLALTAEFQVEDAGSSSALVTAHKDVMRIKREIYACEVTRKGAVVESAKLTTKFAD